MNSSNQEQTESPAHCGSKPKKIAVGIAGTTIYYLAYLLLLTTTGWRLNWSNLQADDLASKIIINVFIMILILPLARWLALKITYRNINI